MMKNVFPFQSGNHDIEANAVEARCRHIYNILQKRHSQCRDLRVKYTRDKHKGAHAGQQGTDGMPMEAWYGRMVDAQSRQA